jgi:Tfp pilus assembly protein FimT
MSRHCNAFTLLEVCLALLIGLVLVLLAVPSLAGLLAEQRLKQAFDRFDRLVSEAKTRSVTEQRAWLLAWDRAGIALAPAGDGNGTVDSAAPKRLAFAKDESFQLQRTAALLKNVSNEWIFWPNGTCEPVVVSFAGPSGKWEASYDPLTARGVFIRSETR